MNRRRGFTFTLIIIFAVATLAAVVVVGVVLRGDTKKFPSPIQTRQTTSRIHLVFLRNIATSTHVIFNGNDLGKTVTRDDIVRDKIFNSVFFIENCANYECLLPVVSGKNIAFMRYVGDELHIIYNGIDQGSGFFPQVSSNHLAFYRKIGNELHIIYDGKDIGEGERMILKDNHLAFFRYEHVPSPFSALGTRRTVAIIRDGEYIARDAYGLVLSGDDYAFGTLRGGCFKPKDSPNSSQCIPDTDLNEYIIFNGQDMGVGAAGSIQIKDGRLLFRRFSDTILDGKNMGNVSVMISGKNVAITEYSGGIQNSNVFLNGKDLGVRRIEAMDGDNFVSRKKVGDSFHIIFNGQDMGEGKSPVLGGGHIAFLRPPTDDFEIFKFAMEEAGIKKSETELRNDFESLSQEEIKSGRLFYAGVQLIYDGKIINADHPAGQQIGDVHLLGDDIVYTVRQCGQKKLESALECKTYIMHNGKNLGEGYEPMLYIE